MGNLPPSAFLPPPPPPQRSLPIIPDAEHRDTVVVGGTRPYYFRKCKRMRMILPTSIESLSDDLLFVILSHLPAQDIYDWTRFVCWKWYRMIHTHSFIYANLQSSTSGLVIQSPPVYPHPIFVSMRQGRIQISKFNYGFRTPIYTGWNGLILGYSYTEFNSMYILNPITKQNFLLPPFYYSVHNEGLQAIAYSSVSMEYKVVTAHLPEPSLSGGSEYELYILTVGVDKSWRPMNIQHLSPKIKKLFGYIPMVTEGFIHWAMSSSYHVVTMNVETEILTETPVPLPQKVGGGGEEKRDTFYMSSGNDRLSLFIACGGFSWDVWEMKPETGEWTKMYNIDMETQKCEFEQLNFESVESLMPAKWLNYQEAFFFHISGTERKISKWSEAKFYYLTLYNLRTRTIEILELDNYYPKSMLIPHRNSLVWMAGS